MLKQIDLHDIEYYDKLSENEQKQLHPLVIQRWLSGASDPNVLQLLNITTNRYIFSLAHHKELLMRALLIVSSGSPRRYAWRARSSKSKVSDSMLDIIREYFGCSLREARLYAPSYTADDMKEMAQHLGYQDDEIKKIFK